MHYHDLYYVRKLIMSPYIEISFNQTFFLNCFKKYSVINNHEKI